MTPLDGTVEAAQAFVDKVVKSKHFQTHAEPTWRGQHDLKTGDWINPDRNRPPQRVMVELGRANMGAAWSSTWVTEHRGRQYPVIRLGQHEHVDHVSSARDPWVILHEIAHQGIDDDKAPHGREFAKLFLGLVKRFLGPDAARALRAEYAANRVRYRTPPNLTPEERERRARAGRQLQASAAEREFQDYRDGLLRRYGLVEEA